MKFFNAYFLIVLASITNSAIAQEKSESTSASQSKISIKIPPSLTQKLTTISPPKVSATSVVGNHLPKDVPLYLYSAITRPLCKRYLFIGGNEQLGDPRQLATMGFNEPFQVVCMSLTINGRSQKLPGDGFSPPNFERQGFPAINPPVSKDGDLACPTGSHLYKNIYFIKPFYVIDEEFILPTISKDILSFEVLNVRNPNYIEMLPDLPLFGASASANKSSNGPDNAEYLHVEGKTDSFANIGEKFNVSNQQACMTPFQYSVYREIVGNNTGKFAAALFDNNVDEKVKENCLKEYKKFEPQTVSEKEKAKQVYQSCLSLNGHKPLPAVEDIPLAKKRIMMD